VLPPGEVRRCCPLRGTTVLPPGEVRRCCPLLNRSIADVFQTVGDAMSDLLAVELILASQDWDVETWNQQYSDLPNRQLKVQVSMK